MRARVHIRVPNSNTCATLVHEPHNLFSKIANVTVNTGLRSAQGGQGASGRGMHQCASKISDRVLWCTQGRCRRYVLCTLGWPHGHPATHFPTLWQGSTTQVGNTGGRLVSSCKLMCLATMSMLFSCTPLSPPFCTPSMLVLTGPKALALACSDPRPGQSHH
jgi:hypothetical protein